MFGIKKKSSCFIMLSLFFIIFALFPLTAHSAKFKVLVVMSYEENFPWDISIREGIESVIAENCDIRYFYMDTKTDLEGGPAKAEDAYKLYGEFQPDGVIVSDDNAQSMFIVPYLKNKVKTPVMFCGVNAQPEKYGYPAANVSGILERYNIKESIALAKQLVPSIKTIGFIGKDSPTIQACFDQVQREKDTYLAQYVDFKMPKTLLQLESMTRELKEKCDVLFTVTLRGIKKKDGSDVDEKDGMATVSKLFGKPLIGAAGYQIDFGALAVVLSTGQEQGRTAAKMLLKAMKGTPVSEIPITQNYFGKRVVNIDVLKEMGIKPNPRVLRGAELIRRK